MNPPQVLYSLLLEEVASSGYTIIATPYAVTFQHLDCARTVRSAFLDAIDILRAGGADAAALAPQDVPLLGLGHSNGALMHLLIGTLEERPTATNILISYNNKCVPLVDRHVGWAPACQNVEGL